MQLGFLKFYKKTKGTTFMDCLLAVDFMSADLTGAVFLIIVIYIVLNLKKRLPTKPTLEAVIITRLTLQEQNSKAQFSLTGLKGFGKTRHYRTIKLSRKDSSVH
jgi:hypothetical protein